MTQPLFIYFLLIRRNVVKHSKARNGTYGERIAKNAEYLYRALEENNALDLVDNTDDCACALFLLAGLKEFGNDEKHIAAAFDANLAKAQVLASYAITKRDGIVKEE